ncbi:MAG: excinuclease ABC subunit UvrC [Ardenticatenia bacterium]|nr:excinuclease ABC subunit UvrC [Ardenticatenia bacterium]
MSSNALPEHIRRQLETLPRATGVYMMKSASGEVLYVGKAVNVRQRVRSYWSAAGQRVPKIRRLTAQVETIEVWTTDSELEALLLENNLIKEHRPRYNVRLKDDKRYPYIRVTWHEPYPKVMMTRQMVRDGSRYFGPFTSAWSVRETLDLLRRQFPYLTCNRTITGQDKRACLYYHIRLCAAPCIGAVTQEEYRTIIQGLMAFLDGHHEELLARLHQEMMEAAERLEFERAAVLRDRIAALKQVVEHQKIVDVGGGDRDVIAFARDRENACVQVFFIRGKLIGRESFWLDNANDEDEAHVMAAFLKQFYGESVSVPSEILLPRDLDEALIIKQWLGQRRGADVVLRVPREGPERALVEMATRNALEALAHLKAHWASQEHRHTEAIEILQQVLSLPHPPVRIECYDVSHTQGTYVVGSMAVLEKGVPRKSHYRRFRVRQARNDDVASLQEIVRRRLENWQEAQHQPGGNPWGLLPDLIVVDGGRGQLNAILAVLAEFQLDDVVPAVALAKREEELYVPGQTKPLRLERSSPALHLLQRVRDEAHRFAVSYQRRLRERNALRSSLDEIPGIGPKRRRRLLRRFGSVDGIRRASVEELAAVPGMTKTLAQRVKDYLGSGDPAHER